MAATGATHVERYNSLRSDSNLSGTETKGYRWGGAVSVFVERPVWGDLAAAVELGYAQKGMQEAESPLRQRRFLQDTDSRENMLHYLSLAPLAKLRNEGATSYLFLGPRLDVLVASEAAAKGLAPRYPYDEFSRMVFGLAAGLGGEISGALGQDIFVELRYNHDLSYSYRQTLESTSFHYEGSIKNRSIDLRVGILL